MRSFRSNQRGRVQPAEYAGEVTKPQQRLWGRDTGRAPPAPRRAGTARRGGPSPIPPIPPVRERPGGAAVLGPLPAAAADRRRVGPRLGTRLTDAWLRARHGLASYGSAAAAGLRPVVGVWATASFCFGGGSSPEEGGKTGILPFLGAPESRGLDRRPPLPQDRSIITRPTLVKAAAVPARAPDTSRPVNSKRRGRPVRPSASARQGLCGGTRSLGTDQEAPAAPVRVRGATARKPQTQTPASPESLETPKRRRDATPGAADGVEAALC